MTEDNLTKGEQMLYVTNADRVREFHTKFNHPVGESPTLLTDDQSNLRLELISEELEELRDGIANGDTVEIADALADLLYVVYGTAIAYGIPIDLCFREVHRSNMTKLGKNGKPIYRDDGKIIKGENYEKPDLKTILES